MYKKSKKSQGMSINVIIIVAICLIVLVVLIAIFTGRMGNFVTGVDTTASCTNACESFGMTKSSTAYTAADSCTGATSGTPAVNNRFVPGTFRDVPSTDVCCCASS